MKIVSYSLIALFLNACGSRPAQLASVQNYKGSADGKVEDADDCKDETAAKPGKVESPTTKPDSADAKPSEPSKDTTADVPKIPTVPTTPVPTPTPAEPEPKVDERLEKIKAMLSAKRLVSEYTVSDSKNWGTSKDKRIEILVAVDDKGKALVPTGINNPELNGNTDASKDPSFKTTMVHSTLKICNQAKSEIRLHAEGGLPFGHGMANINKGACTIYLLKNSNMVADGKSWDHIIGSQFPVYFKVVKIKPDGTEMP